MREIIAILVEKHVNHETIKIVVVILLHAIILTVCLTKINPNSIGGQGYLVDLFHVGHI